MKLSLYTASLLFAALSLNGSEQPLITSLSEDMEQATHIATQTNQNIDYQPFILSVWEQKDLLSFGARTLKDALMLVPGVDMMGDTINNRTPVIRGSNPLAYGQTKLAIDGIVVNDRTFDSYSAYLDMPIELIQRIEIVRGAGSFIEGVNGYSGSINVITYAQGEQLRNEGTLFGSYGSDNARQGGFWYNHQTSEYKLAGDLFYQSSDAASPISVTDKYGNIGYAPLNSRQIGAGLSYHNGNFSLKGRYNLYKTGSAFGNLNALPNPEGKQINSSWYLESAYAYAFTHDWILRLKAGVMQDSWESNARSLPPGTYGTITFPIGYWGFLEFDSRLMHGNIATTYTGLDHHTITAGYTLKYENVFDMSSITTQRINGGTVLVDYTDIAPFLDAGAACRHTHEIYISDTIDLSEDLAFSLYGGGTKASNFSFEPYIRGALVYQPHRRHILKLMAGNSYRLPSFQEMYVLNNPARKGNPELEPEHVISYEAQYLYKPTAATTLGVNIFYLRNKDQITSNTVNNIYQNIGERNILGYEAEFRGSIGENDLVALSYSYITGDTKKENVTTGYLPYASQHLIKGAFSYALTPEIKAGAIARYSSAKERRPNDLRSPMESFTSLDLMLGWENSQGVYLQGILKNIADEIYRYPSPPATYSDDYPIEGRTFWVRAGWKF